MDVIVKGDDPFGDEAYKKLFEDTMSDLNKAVLIDRAQLVLKPKVPLFVFSIVLKADPGNKTVVDVSNVREEGGMVYVTITQERYAPDVLRALWTKYGRNKVVQQTRFDIEITGAKMAELQEMVIASGEDDLREIMGAIWRSMPEGIKNRRTLIDGGVITVIATEELMQPEMMDEGRAIHVEMGGAA
ncbi:MAG: methanogenesis marker 17 protein [Candidatus Methanomethylophilaceae archaeon]|nr:methanogenesis marker 17 protein [Candidatus Methanomethylophilaceae archaeon]MBR4203113.1 methanogenesis marker 17 protein [Candidatus Methanomethylophilaceae archaeon]MBR6910605.1 methanogenesis marker 17 protein [Candidatus Methanomethylophilaceae archaeon]